MTNVTHVSLRERSETVLARHALGEAVGEIGACSISSKKNAQGAADRAPCANHDEERRTMDRRLMKKLAMVARVAEFQRAHPFSDRNQATVGRRFEERLAEAQSLFLQEHEARSAESASTQHRQALRRELVVTMRTVAQIGRLSVGDDPRLASRFQAVVHTAGNAAFVAQASSLLEVATEHQDLLIRSGLLRAQLTALATGLAEHRKAMDAASALRRKRHETGGALRGAMADLGKLVRLLDVFQRARFAGDPNLLGTWIRLRTVASLASRRRSDAVAAEGSAPPTLAVLPQEPSAGPPPVRGGESDPLPGDGGQQRAA